MNALATTNQNAVTAADDFDPFAAYAASAGTRIVGTMLKFSKGDYLVGQNGDLMQEGTQLAAHMNELTTGWIKWKDKRPVEQVMGTLFERFAPPQRDTLGDRDESLWELDTDGKPQDPWQFTNYLLLKVPGSDDQDALFTFATSSHGGLNALRNLSGAYSKQKRMRKPGEMPIVKLGVERYEHKKYGWLKNPQFTIVGWVAAGEFEAAMAEEQQQAAADAAARKEADDIPF